MNYALSLSSSIVRPIVLRWKLSLKTVWILTLSVVCFLLVFYIFQISEMTRASFAVSNYERKMAQLINESKGLEINFSNISSLNSLEALLASLNYQDVGKVHYIEMLEGAVAAK
ncbi:MAG: hypothetical protein Q8P63_02800 [Candidatus Nealsonbacteria bacterium]|nr:hypothetical protein [Candidatus Nealsonbacteria bacterium]